MLKHFGSCGEGKSDSSFSWTFLQGFLAKSRKMVPFSMLCPYHGEHVAACLFGAMSYIWNPIFSIIFSFPNPHSFNDFNQGLFWSILCFITQFLLHHRTAPVPSLPGLCSCQGSWFDFPGSWAGWAALLPCLACRWSFLGLSLIVSTALEVLKLSDITFEM